MKRNLLIPIGIIFLIVFACNKDETPAPTCTDGILNGNETDIDCGGDCDECFACTTTYCSYLSGATTDEVKTSVNWVGKNANWKFTIYSNGKFHEEESGAGYNGTWEFDNPDSPHKLRTTYPALNGLVANYPIIKLVADTLILNNSVKDVTFEKQ